MLTFGADWSPIIATAVYLLGLACFLWAWYRLRRVRKWAADTISDQFKRSREWCVKRAQTVWRGLNRLGRAFWPATKGILVLTAGLYLAGLPTYYTIFTIGHMSTTATDDRHWGRVLFPAWIAIAAFVGYRTLTGDREVLRLLRASVSRQASWRARASAKSAIDLMLHGETAARAEALRAYEPKIYEIDDPGRPTELTPFLDDNPPAYDRWAKDEGVLWFGFNVNDPTAPSVFTGHDLTRATRALDSAEQRTRFGHLTLVAAIVIRDATNLPIGVLSCSSSDATELGIDERRAMVTLAAELGILLQLTR
ncbi:MAG: hypothetical protein ACLP50_07890 [Solirubrobacteraceae bacterium]